MKLLLDTQLLLWIAVTPERLGDAARTLIEDRDNELVFSVVSIWETAIKAALGRSDFTANPRRIRQGLLERGYQELTVTGAHALAVGELPPIHRDPFDRLLVAQAYHEGLVLLTTDRVLADYPTNIRLV